MTPRVARTISITTAAIGALFVLAGCAGTPTTPQATVTVAPPQATGPASTSPSTEPSTDPSTAPTTPATTPPTTTTTGCKANSGTKPAGAATRTIPDIDGHGTKDAEWISDTPTLRFGVTTASGATFSYALPSASPAAREGFVTRLNDHRIVSIVDDNRAAYVHFFVNCGWVTPKDSHGVQYTFDMNDFAGHGTGVGCSAGFVVGYQTKNHPTGWTLTQTQLYLNATGSVASNGPTTVVAKNMSSSDPRLVKASTISCGSVTVKNGGVSVG